jgi:hypothetical protein
VRLKAARTSSTEVSRASIVTAYGVPLTWISGSIVVGAIAKAAQSKVAVPIPQLGVPMVRIRAIAELINFVSPQSAIPIRKHKIGGSRLSGSSLCAGIV